MEESLFLTKFAKKVTVVHRRDEFRASKIMQERVLNHEQIEVAWNKEVIEIKGDKQVSSVILKDSNSNEEEEKEIDGVFVAIGHTPNVDFLDGFVELDEKGYIKTGFTSSTSIERKGMVEFSVLLVSIKAWLFEFAETQADIISTHSLTNLADSAMEKEIYLEAESIPSG